MKLFAFLMLSGVLAVGCGGTNVSKTEVVDACAVGFDQCVSDQSSQVTCDATPDRAQVVCTCMNKAVVIRCIIEINPPG